MLIKLLGEEIMKKWCVVVLAIMAIVVFTGSFTSCKKSSSSAAAAGSQGTAASSEPLDVLMWTRDIANFAEMDYYKQLEAQTGIKINLTTADQSEWTTKTNLMFASGEYADVILRGGIEVEQYGVDQKILIPLEDYIEKYMPNYKAILSRDPALLDYMRASDGHVYYTGFLMPQNINVESHLFINKAWLDKLGLPVPTTFAEFENTLRAFRDQDPNGNGIKDEFPFSGTWGGYESVLEFLSFWGMPYKSGENWLYITDDHRVTSQLLHENFRSAMETLNRWYNEGLIDMETFTQDLNAHNAKLNSGLMGTLWRWRMTAMSTPENITAQYIGILPIAALPGVKPRVHRYLELPGTGAYITSTCKDIEKASKWIDANYIFENQLNAYYGPYKEVVQDGKTVEYGWKFDDQGKVNFYTGDYEANPNQSALHFYSGPEYFEKFNMPPQRIEKTTYCEIYTDAGMVETNSGVILTSLVKMSAEDMARRDLLKAQIDTFAKESITGFITKGVTDAGWNTFTATLQNLHLDEYIALYQAAYDRYRAGAGIKTDAAAAQ
jgi:putative aldouronate transport system substrate-binding protein